MSGLSALVALALAAFAEASERTDRGEAIDKTIFDHIEEQAHLRDTVNTAREWLTSHPNATFKAFTWFMFHELNDLPQDEALRWLSDHPDMVFKDFVRIKKLSLSPEGGEGPTLYGLLYMVGRTQPPEPIWRLTPDATELLLDTDLPADLVDQRLPDMPERAILVKLPDDVTIDTIARVTPKHDLPGPPLPRRVIQIAVTSVLVVEQIPNRKWRMIGLQDSNKFEKVRWTQGYLDLRAGRRHSDVTGEFQVTPSLIEQLEHYELTGEDEIWKLLVNLFLTLEHRQLAGRVTEPRMPKSSKKRKRFARRKSSRPYIVVDLSEPVKRSAGRARTTPTGRASPKMHWVSGHWRSYWVLDPQGRPTYGTKEREDGPALHKIARRIDGHWKGVERPVEPGERREVRVKADRSKGLVRDE